MEAGKKGVPLNAWHGMNDTATPNTYTAGLQALNWYKAGKGPYTPVWNPLSGVGHGSDVYAYDTSSGLKEWIDGLFPDIEEPEPPTPAVNDSILYQYFRNDSIFFKSKAGVIKGIKL